MHRAPGLPRPFLAPGLLALALAGCRGAAAPAPRPNLLLITIDTLRADHCSSYGYARPTTPRLDEVAREGLRFETAYAPMATTAPSHATMLTSLYPISHGVLKNGFVLEGGFTTLAEVLAGRGYQTAAIVSSFALDHRFGLDQGFASYQDDFAPAESSTQLREWEGQAVPAGFDRRADATSRRALEWLAEGRDPARPFFLWIHYFDPHSPYDPPEPYRSRFAPPRGAGRLETEVAAYDGEIAFADAEIGAVLDALGRAGLDPETLVVVAGDHGEGLMQHGHMEHGLYIYEEAVRVPWVLRWPGRVPAGATVGAPVELVDLMPTVLDLLGATPPGRAFQGQSLEPVVLGRTRADPERRVYLERRLYESSAGEARSVREGKFGIRGGRWKYIEAPAEGTRELFDLHDDPGELSNLADQHRRRAADLARQLHAWQQALARAPASRRALSPEEVERLKALGYVQ